MMVRKDLDIAKEIARRLRKRIGPELEQMLFFGSRARGIPKPYSDYDFLIVLRHRNTAIIDEIYEETTDFELEHEIDVSLKLYSVDDFKWKMAMGVPFMKSILQSGIPL